VNAIDEWNEADRQYLIDEIQRGLVWIRANDASSSVQMCRRRRALVGKAEQMRQSLLQGPPLFKQDAFDSRRFRLRAFLICSDLHLEMIQIQGGTEAFLRAVANAG
jgi:hypothetical protein